MDLLNTQFALRLIVKTFAEASEKTRYGRTVVGVFKNYEDLEAHETLRQDLDQNPTLQFNKACWPQCLV